jgi:hypothetical protein
MMECWAVMHGCSDVAQPWCARRWIGANGRAMPTDQLIVGNSLEEVRAKLPPGLLRTERHWSDDPVIREVWI